MHTNVLAPTQHSSKLLTPRLPLSRPHHTLDPYPPTETDYLTASTTRETMADITITEIGLENTLLLDAINKGKARFVSDCASYLQVGNTCRLTYLLCVVLCHVVLLVQGKWSVVV